MGSEETKPAYRPSSTASLQSQKNLRARYWSYLFDNFHRAVDEIYSTCENDESIIECKVVISYIIYILFLSNLCLPPQSVIIVLRLNIMLLLNTRPVIPKIKFRI